MFVDIEKFEGALAIENLLMPYKKGRLSDDKKNRLPKEPITREVCMEVLQSTNYSRNIKDMLQCIAELPQEEQAQFKDVVLACFSNREQSDDVWDIAKNLAQTSGYLPQLLNEPDNVYDGRFFYSANYLKEAVSTKEEKWSPEWSKCGKITFCGKRAKIENQTNFPPYMEFFQVSDAQMENNDMTGVENIYFREADKQVRLVKLQNLSAALTFDAVFHVGLLDIDFSQCHDLRFLNIHDASIHNAKGLPEILDVSTLQSVFIDSSDLASVREFKLNSAHNQFSIVDSSNLPDNMMIDGVSMITLTGSSWVDADNLTLKNADTADFDGAFHLPKNIKFQNVKQAQFRKTDFGDVRSVACHDMSYVDFAEAKYLPSQIELKNCEIVDFQQCDLARVEHLDLSEVTKTVLLSNSTGLPPILDLKNLDNVICMGADLKGVEKICLRDVANVSLTKTKNVEAEIEINGCTNAELADVDFKNVSQLKLWNISKEIDLSDSFNLPQNLALSDVEKVNLLRTRFADGKSLKLQNIKNVNFEGAADTPKMMLVQNVQDFNARHGCFSKTDCLICRKMKTVSFLGSQKLPKKMVFEDCTEVWLLGTNGENLEEIEFKNVKEVHVYRSKNFSQKWDFSKVDEPDLNEAHFSDGAEIIFKDRKQMVESKFVAGDTLTVRFADDEKTPLWNWFGLKKHSR